MLQRLAIISLIITFFACRKASEQQSSSLYGRWRLSETLSDPGNGSGKWTKAPWGIIIEFKPRGELGYNTAFSHFDRYSISSDSMHITFINSSMHDSASLWYSLSPGLLTISPQCIEACGARFVPTRGIF